MSENTMILTCVSCATTEPPQIAKILELLVDPVFDLVLCPPQARETAETIGGKSPKKVIETRLEIPTLLDLDSDGLNFLKLFNELGKKPLHEYFGSVEQQLQPGGQERLDSLICFGEKIWQRVWANEHTKNLRRNKQDSRVLIVGHPMILSLMGFVADPLTNHVLSVHKMGECGAFNMLWQDNEEGGGIVNIIIIS